MTEPAFTLSAERVFRAMDIAISDTNGTLQRGIHIEPIADGGVWIVATTRSCMLIQRDRDGYAKDNATLCITPPIAFDATDIGLDKGQYHWCGAEISIPPLNVGEVVVANATWTIDEPGPHILAERLDDKLPDWRRALGRTARRDSAGREIDTTVLRQHGFNRRYISALTQDHATFSIHQNYGDSNQVLITFEEDPDTLAVMMLALMPKGTPGPQDILTDIGRADLISNARVH